jgi:hypothetical protein
VRQVRKQRALGAELLRNLHCLLQVEVRRVRLAAQGVQYQQAQPLQSFPSVGRDITHIGHIREVADAERQNRHLAVKHAQRLDGQFAYLQYAREFAKLNLGRADAWRIRKKDVSEHALEVVQRAGFGVHRHGASCINREPANVVQPHDVVGVRVGNQHGV